MSKRLNKRLRHKLFVFYTINSKLSALKQFTMWQSNGMLSKLTLKLLVDLKVKTWLLNQFLNSRYQCWRHTELLLSAARWRCIFHYNWNLQSVQLTNYYKNGKLICLSFEGWKYSRASHRPYLNESWQKVLPELVWERLNEPRPKSFVHSQSRWSGVCIPQYIP